ncbi:unnamed protein product [Effrenium voratum]|nr:unnamed protein product [Effrenium voratum]
MALEDLRPGAPVHVCGSVLELHLQGAPLPFKAKEIFHRLPPGFQVPAMGVKALGTLQLAESERDFHQLEFQRLQRQVGELSSALGRRQRRGRAFAGEATGSDSQKAASSGWWEEAESYCKGSILSCV